MHNRPRHDSNEWLFGGCRQGFWRLRLTTPPTASPHRRFFIHLFSSFSLFNLFVFSSFQHSNQHARQVAEPNGFGFSSPPLGAIPPSTLHEASCTGKPRVMQIIRIHGPVFHVTFPQHNASAATLAFLPPPHSAPSATQSPLMANDGWIRGQ